MRSSPHGGEDWVSVVLTGVSRSTAAIAGSTHVAKRMLANGPRIAPPRAAQTTRPCDARVGRRLGPDPPRGRVAGELILSFFGRRVRDRYRQAFVSAAISA